MRATIEKVSKYGIMLGGDWKNLSKFHKGVSLDGFSSGDEVDVTLQKDKFITSLAHANGESNGGSNGRQEVSETGNTNASQHTGSTGRGLTNGNYSNARQETITRLSVISSVLGSPWLGEYYKSMDYSQAVSESLTLVERLTQLAEGKANEERVAATV